MGRNTTRQEQALTLGEIVGAHGVKGWIRVHSYTEPREAILSYSPWLLGEQHQAIGLLDGSLNGKSLIARLEGINDRDQAEALRGVEIRVERHQLPATGKNQYYWADLIGLDVVHRNGELLGKIEQMMATGANDVMVVEGDRQRLIPFLMGNTVLEVDLEARRIVVDWDSEF